MSAQKLKQLFQTSKFQECIDLALSMLQKNRNDKQALLFVAQSQVKIGMLTDSQNNLNCLQSILQPGIDDALIFAQLMTQEEIAIELQKLTNKQQRTQGRKIQIKNKYKIIEFLEMKQKFAKMVEETEIYVVLLLEEQEYKEIEDTYLWLLNHKQLSDEIRVKYGARIFEIDEFYNPYTRIDVLFPKLYKIAPQSEDLMGLALKMMEILDKQASKKSVGSCFQQSDNNNYVQQYKDFCEQIKQIGDIVFTSTDKIFQSKTSIRMFTRYLGAISVTTIFLSDDWVKLETKAQQLLHTQFCQNTFGDLAVNPIQIYLMAIVDVSKVIRQARIPDFDELLVSKMPQLNECMDTFSRDFSEYSQYVNAYFAICAMSQNCPLQFEAQTIKSKVNQALFIIRKVQFSKFYQQRDTSDHQIYLSCLTLKLNLPKDEFTQNFTQVELLFEKSKRDCSKAVIEFYQGIIADLKWQSNLISGQWLQAIQALDELAAQNADKVDFVTVKKAKIQVQNLDKICANEDKDIFLVGIMSSLQNCAATDAENLLIQGYLMWTYPQLYNADQKAVFNKWMLALKKDQTNPEIYYSLGVYYYITNDFKRAQGCLDKVLKLQPDFEQALVISFQLAQDTEQRLQLVDKFMETNRNVAVTYFFRGLIMQQKQDYFQAIEMYQNAIKFYTIQNSKPKSLLLLPELTLQIHKNPFGIYGNANPSVCWVYQSECFLKIDKPQVALKCFVQALDEITKVKLNQVPEVTADIQGLLTIINLDSFQPVPVEVEGVVVPEPIIPLLSNLQPSKWALECLMLGSKLVAQPQLSITILNAALKCSPTQPMLAFILTELLSRVTVLVEQGILFENGQIKLQENTAEIIQTLQQLIDYVSVREQYITCQNLQKKRLNAIFAIAQRTQSQDNYRQAMDTASQLVSKGVYYPSLILDYAKIVHEYQRFVNDDQLQNLKISLIKKAILLDPSQANLWVHLHVFSVDESTRAKAIFKAYDLDKENVFVQETILKYYLQTKQWSKGFKIIIKSYQRATNANEPQMPIVLATLAYFNAVCYFKNGQRQQLLEALSLIKLVEREDMKLLLSEIFVYLSFYNGDYENTLSYLQSQPKSTDVDLCLLKASFGSQSYQYDQVVADASQVLTSQQQLQEVVNIQSLSNELLKQRTIQSIHEFSVNSIDIAPLLALQQELCLQRKIVLQENILDIPKVMSLINKLNTNLQRTLLIQSLRLLQLRDGTIKEPKPLDISDLNNNRQQSDSDKSYSHFVIEASRLKPQFLTAAQHKALLTLYLNTLSDPTSLQGVFVESNSVADKFKMQGLKLVIQQRKLEVDQAAAQLELNPECVQTNIKYLWSQLKQGKIQETIQSYNELIQKFPEVQNGDNQVKNVLNALTQKNIQGLTHRMRLITCICKNLTGNDQAINVDINTTASSIVQNIKCVQDQSQFVDLLFATLKVTLFEQGHYLVYNKLVKQIVEFAAVAQLKVVNQIWNYQLLNTASGLIQLRKVTQLIPLCKEIDEVSTRGEVVRPLLPVNLLRARAYLALNNHQQLQQSLNVDDTTLERDFLQALALYSAQDYKQYYLTCLGLVAGAKTAQVSSWSLAYAYYLKAFAEMTFLVAKRNGIKLKDDFTQADGDYSADFFKAKAKTTLTKCLFNLDLAGEQSGMLKQAVDIMMQQI